MEGGGPGAGGKVSFYERKPPDEDEELPLIYSRGNRSPPDDDQLLAQAPVGAERNRRDRAKPTSTRNNFRRDTFCKTVPNANARRENQVNPPPENSSLACSEVGGVTILMPPRAMSRNRQWKPVKRRP